MSQKHKKEMELYDSTVINSICAERDLPTKRQRIINEVVSKFEFKAKQDEFARKVERTTSHFVLDKMVWDIVLRGYGDQVIK